MTCTHDGPCGAALSATSCALVCRAEARKYDCNLTWHIAELAPDVWCLYTPDRRRPMSIGTLEQVIEAYRNREPVILHRAAPAPKRFANVTFDL